ncbi:cell surface calcium-binding acidic-repeat protein [Flavobacterium limnosediminis JC2902]|uniref:Cell surface calcium-binding acidic-repeat protein n=1 Tax=Flavobacterium limnosediminis JC2902 TaxID=1341181 RepID=V6SKG7_9FLAO|nr:LamG-like jellyroll fold domain-containing protein [Flavobacterium limnosediminis]ESU26939.1 cell surface calcium-binding acidic-repeat protein [Flavobacterium limnosediminis JC2902]
MKRKNTLTIYHLLLIVAFFFLGCLTSQSQTLITYQGFDSTPSDVWPYTNTLNTGTIATYSTTFVSSPNSLRLTGSNNSGGGGPSNNDPYITFDNVNISAYTNCYITLSFSSDGSPVDKDDLYLDVSYDNGSTYNSANSIKLIDGKNDTSDNLGFSHVASTGNTQGSPYTFNIPNGTTQVKIKIRFDEDNGENNTTHHYLIDNVSLYGTINSSITITGLSNNTVAHNSLASTTNGTDFGQTQIAASPVLRNFTIKNIGSSTINLTGSPLVNIIGSTDFSVTSLPITPINTSGSTTFQITFNPSSIGTKSAQISIASNDTDENPYVFAITGQGIQTFYDSDNDGLLDNVDIDDDNDGIRDSVEENNCLLANGPKVNYKFLNETFGTGTRTTINTTYNATTTYCYENGSTGEPNTPQCPDLSSADLNDGKYTVGASAQIASWAASYWHMGGDHTGDTNGRMAIFNASYTPGVFYTATITGALPNIPISYSFWVLNLDRTNAPGIATRLRPDVRVEFRDMSNNLITFIETGDIPPTTAGNLAGDWYNFTSNLTLNVSAFKVIFINNETGGAGNDLALDDILISQTLCDLDGDGVADVFDLDSDNDGIEDILEVGLGHLSNGKGRFDVAWSDANTNGLHDSVEALTLLDSDGDGAPNYMDLDSDNDSVFDVDESWAGNINAYAGYENGDGDINGDGVGDGPESETFRNKDTNGDGITEGYGDGVLDIYDYAFNSYGNLDQGSTVAPFLNYVKDTDGDGIHDYMDVKSNGTDFDISLGLYASLDANNNGIIDGTADIDHDGILDAFDTNTAKFGSPRNLERKLLLDFDGRNDYATDVNLTNNLSNATLMAWININSAFTSEGVIVGQNNFQLKVNNSENLQAVVKSSTLTAATPLVTSQWIHVAVSYNGTTGIGKLYVNGQAVATTTLSGNLGADTSLFTIGKNPASSSNFFKGKIDEVRLFNVALSDTDLQKMIYQEIKNNSGIVRGEIVPKDITGLSWTNMIRYFRMDNYKDDVIDNHATATIDIAPGARIYNVKTINTQQAPMPFITEQDGSFSTAANSVTKQIRGLDVTDNNWAIIQVNHNINSTSNHTNLGMFVAPSVLVEINNDSKLQNEWYLKLDGKIDLQGRSQLVQTADSDLDPASTGELERDQQGTGNKFNYNYWSSPVSTQASTTSNNTGFTVNNVLRDGTNPLSPQPISWIGGYDGSANPMRLARYWLFKFTNLSPVYANWQRINENTLLQTGQAFTMKGSGIAVAPAINTQNYVFKGKPNNGLINNVEIQVAANNQNLVGNPYPSALDANEFITDNLAGTTGALYFWEHYPSNNTHVLAGYQGGYAVRNLVGGTIPVSPALISGLGSSLRIPGRFIPVGQGFFIKGNLVGGQLVYKNSQRKFIKEDNIDSNIMFRTNETENNNNNNNDDVVENDTFGKIRLGFTGVTNLHRQLLLGFMNENADDNFNLGYDAEVLDIQTNDMYFQLGDRKLLIQGVGHFNTARIIPLTIQSSTAGTVKFMIDGIENFDNGQPIYIYDKVTDSYHDIRNHIFELWLPAGTTASRFTLRFTQETLSVDDIAQADSFNIFYNANTEQIQISNQLKNDIITEVTLFSILGQKIKTINTENRNQQLIEIPKTNLSTGIYIVQLKTMNSKIHSEKLSIK